MDLAIPSRFHRDRPVARPPALAVLLSAAVLLVILAAALLATGAADRLDVALTASWRWAHALPIPA